MWIQVNLFLNQQQVQLLAFLQQQLAQAENQLAEVADNSMQTEPEKYFSQETVNEDLTSDQAKITEDKKSLPNGDVFHSGVLLS